MPNNQIDLHIITYYEPEDTKFRGDYTRIQICRKDGSILKEYGDYYHDKGLEKVYGFIGGVQSMGYEVVVTNESRLDDTL